MKRILKLSVILLLCLSIPIISASGQDKKNENKIKVIIVDDSGTRTFIDTTFTGDKMPEIITLKNGKAIYVTKEGIDLEELEKDDKNKKVMVTVSSHNDGEESTQDKIVYFTSDSLKWDMKTDGEEGRVYVYSHASSEGKPKKHVMIASTGDGKIKHAEGNSFTVTMSDDNEESGSDAPKYIIAKDGVVVTIQTENEEKAKELQQLIENKLGVKKSGK